jgi:hypothetical protein
MNIDRNDDSETTFDSIRVNHELDSNMTDDDTRDEKHSEPRIYPWLGINIDRSDALSNVLDSIRVVREFDSNRVDSRCHSVLGKAIDRGSHVRRL